MGVVIDTNVFIIAERSKEPGKLSKLLSLIPPEYGNSEACISVITASELLMGVHRARDPKFRNRRQMFVDSVLDQFAAISITSGIAREHSRICAELATKGEPIGTHDSWIAACAFYGSHAVLTSNVREFSRVEGLTVLNIRVE